jgi:hypothetical protein
MAFSVWMQDAWQRLGKRPVLQALVTLFILVVLLAVIIGLPCLLPEPPYDRDALLRGEPDPSVPYYAKVLVAQLLLLAGLVLGSIRWLTHTQSCLFMSLQLVAILLFALAGIMCLFLGLMLMFFRLGPNPEGLFG